MSTSTLRREVLMPRIGPAMAHGRIERWHVAEGQTVAAGDVLAEITTVSATMEIEAKAKGRVERILVPAGTAGVMVDTPIAILLDETQPGVRPPQGQARLAAVTLESVEPFDVPAGEGEEFRSYREALRDALAEEMRDDPTVFVLGAEVAQNRGALKVTQGLLDKFGPDRVVSVPPLDDAVLGLAMGAALYGLRPVVEITSWARAAEALEALMTTAGALNFVSGGTVSVPIVFRGPNGFEPGVAGADGRCMASALAQIPGIKVVVPATPGTALGLLKAAIRDGGPVAFLEHSLLYGERGPASHGTDNGDFILGQARIAASGSDITIAAYGRAVGWALEAAAVLEGDGVSTEVIDLMSVRPLDTDTIIHSVKRTGRLITVEEGMAAGGIGAEIIAAVTSAAFDELTKAPLRVAGRDVPMPYAEDLQALSVPSAEAVIKAVRTLLQSG